MLVIFCLFEYMYVCMDGWMDGCICVSIYIYTYIYIHQVKIFSYVMVLQINFHRIK